jgi:hypothetical protein
MSRLLRHTVGTTRSRYVVHVDLCSALRIVGTPLGFPGRGDSALVEKVRPHVTGDDDWLREANRLHGGASIRPVDILRALAVATRPRYEGSEPFRVTAYGAV